MAAAGALTACVPGGGPKDPSPEVVPFPPVRPGANCRSAPAHDDAVTNLFTLDDTLFSLSHDHLKAWSWTRAELIQSVPRIGVGPLVAKNPGTFPVLFQHLERGVSPKALSADGRTLASLVRPAGSDGEIEIWSSESGQSVKIQTLRELKAEWFRVGLSADGKTMAVSKPGGLIDIWSVGAEAPRLTLQLEAGGVGHSLAILSDQELMVCGTNVGTLAIWSLSDRKIIKTVKLNEGELFGVLALAPGGDLAAAKSGDDLALVTLPEGRIVGRLSPHQATFSTASFSADGRRLATGSVQGEINLWDLKSALMVGCLFDPAETMEGTAVSRGRVMGLETRLAPCGTPLPPGATCLCDCVAASRAYETTNTICACDLISVPAGYTGGNIICVCDTIMVGTKQPKPKCVCVGNVETGGHYWRPN